MGRRACGTISTIIPNLFAALFVANAACARIIEEVVEIPVEATDRKGQTVSHSIKVTVIRDDARARSGFLVFNHGRSPKREANQSRAYSSTYRDNARWFASKGFVVFLPMRVGYGGTGGPDVEESGPCNAKNYPPVYDAAAAQTLKVIEYAKGLPYIDATNGVVAGQSFGGTTAITLAARNVPGVRAVVNFAGGGGGNPETLPEKPCGESRLAELFASYGAIARIPTLWLYSENDLYWGKDKPHGWFDGFIARGGAGRFVQLPPYRSDGHPIYTGNPSSWRPELETFLHACCGETAAAPPPARAGDKPESFTSPVSGKESVRGSRRPSIGSLRRRNRRSPRRTRLFSSRCWSRSASGSLPTCSTTCFATPGNELRPPSRPRGGRWKRAFALRRRC